MTGTARCRNPMCHRPLSDPKSRARGYGPDCWKAYKATIIAQPVIPLGDTSRWDTAMDGQNEIETEGDEACPATT